MKIFKSPLLLAAIFVPTLLAETRCPGNVGSVSLRLANGYQMIVSVFIDAAGPYDFLLDTGTQFTMVDPSLATQLHLDKEDSIPVAGTGFRSSASTAQIDRLDVGLQSVSHLQVVVYDLRNLRSLGLRVQGILGEDFLQHFDMLIDYQRRLLCLDDSGAMRAHMKGQHIPLATASETDNAPPNSLIVTARLSNAGPSIRLKLDSGANAPVLHNAFQLKPEKVLKSGLLRGSGTDGSQRAFVALPLQNMEIGPLSFPNVHFFALANASDESNTSGFDGLLPLRLFQRVFISHREHFAIMETP